MRGLMVQRGGPHCYPFHSPIKREAESRSESSPPRFVRSPCHSAAEPLKIIPKNLDHDLEAIVEEQSAPKSQIPNFGSLHLDAVSEEFDSVSQISTFQPPDLEGLMEEFTPDSQIPTDLQIAASSSEDVSVLTSPESTGSSMTPLTEMLPAVAEAGGSLEIEQKEAIYKSKLRLAERLTVLILLIHWREALACIGDNSSKATNANVPEYVPTVVDNSVDESEETSLLNELAEMGFMQVDMDKDILRPNENNIEHSVDEPAGFSSWDTLLEDLKELGFHDEEMNKKLLAKNDGSIKRAVLDLIAEDKHEWTFSPLSKESMLGARGMDVVWGETAGVEGQLWLLRPILFILQGFEAYVGMLLLRTAVVGFVAEWQVIFCGLLLVVMAVGNFLNTVQTLMAKSRVKAKMKRSKSKQELDHLSSQTDARVGRSS